MEVEAETAANVALFWTLFNEALQKVSNQDQLFQPVGWCTDMAGANLAGITSVFGEAARSQIKSCEFHFKDHRNKKANRLDQESSVIFKGLCDGLLESATEKQYDIMKTQMDEFIAEKDDRAFLKSWISWWHDRRGFIFRAFAPRNGPHMNQAEVVHAGWAHRDRANLTLLDACQADVRDSLILDVEIKAFGGGTQGTQGKGPSFAERNKRRHNTEMRRAKQLGHELLQTNRSHDEGLLVDPSSSHRPAKERKKRGPTRSAKNRRHPDGSGSSSGASSNLDLFEVHSAEANVSSIVSNVGQGRQCLPYGTANENHVVNLGQQPVAPVCVNRPPSPLIPWHAGMSPNQYEIIELPVNVKKCYGCGTNFADKYRNPPYNLIVKHVDRRVVKRDERTGQLIYSHDFSNTYYHPIVSHIIRKNPVFTRLVSISRVLFNSLDNNQRTILDSSGLNIIVNN